MEKGIKNANTIVRKLRQAWTRATNKKLEVARKKKQKREEMVERRKRKAMVARRQRVRGRISLSSKEEEIMRVTSGIKQIQIKPAIIKTHCISERGAIRRKYEQLK